MKLISQHTKKIMEECKLRARDEGLHFDNETLEYVVTNRDMIELSPKGMIPTVYDYWADDVQVLKKEGEYKLYPSNPYETVINTRPAISFYNDNNPDWLNIMIFYHVLAHIDFFQNNIYFQHTWDYDFAGKALSDKRLINSLRSIHGRWVDYVIEFSRGIDNIIGYFPDNAHYRYDNSLEPSEQVDFYFKVFLQEILKVPEHIIYKEVEKYNKFIEQNEQVGEMLFFAEVRRKFPEFEAKRKKYKPNIADNKDVMQYIMENSEFLNKEKNSWMKSVIEIVRETAVYFAPQIRTKTINEGWASYWHEYLFMKDKRISGHESTFAKINAGVTSISRVGLNPYAIGLRLFWHIEDSANKGKFNSEYQKIQDAQKRQNFDKKLCKGKEAIFEVREKFNDFNFFNTFVNQDFTDKHNLFTVGKRYNEQQQVMEYFVDSRKAKKYKKMLINSLYHPPYITVDKEKTSDSNLYLKHHFEGKQLYKEFIPETLIGIEYLWGNQVQLETTEIVKKQNADKSYSYERQEIIYTIKNKSISKVKKVAKPIKS